ncbi:hypothetical protein [Alkaliphilus serpentinus]|uniref:Uncharacterized protein n=1 Tax=Alkaliphilus serpentinus TaxID=1482731 RepID=A0A833MEE5_9FIRM|nr:hypothetical protein [Alkaliphilus serpentinus]KAB3531075.1 hypothetical protein F8153_05415 [Alkaliphilus serpentinus]
MKKELWIIIAILMIAATFIFGTTMAYFTGDAPIDDTPFTFGTLNLEATNNSQVGGEWIPVPGDNVKVAEWSFTNTGTKEAYVRATIELQLMNSGEEIQINENSFSWSLMSQDWKEEKDKDSGVTYYYYTEVIEPDETVELKLQLVLNQINGSIMGGEFQVDIEAFAIQTSNHAAYYKWETEIYGRPAQ